jgi:hypothetical protein
MANASAPGRLTRWIQTGWRTYMAPGLPDKTPAAISQDDVCGAHESSRRPVE